MRSAAFVFVSLVALCWLDASPSRAAADGPIDQRFCKPTQQCWPTPVEWAKLRASLAGTLEEPRSPIAPCLADAAGAACATALRGLASPYALQEQSGGTESIGWLDAWTAAPSAYAVVAENAGDVAAAIRFARAHRLRLVVKGTGHDYLGRSNAPDSLLVWTHRMRRVAVEDTFVPASCSVPRAPIAAVSLGAGTRWLEAYREVTGKHHRYVQGGGCLSVGAAGGFLQGGGFGSWSKKYGIAAASLLEAEVVTADGQVRIANECQNADLFWALRGGGGGTFGVVTRVTLMTHALPRTFGHAAGTIQAHSDAAMIELLQRFLVFYGERLSDEHWGEKIGFGRDNELEIDMLFQGLTATEAEAVWQPFRQWIAAHPDRYTMSARFSELSPERIWDYSYFAGRGTDVVATDAAAQPLWWWKGNEEELFAYWLAYASRFIPIDRFQPATAPAFARVLFAASRHWWVSLHFNKGQAGAAPEALARDRRTAMNPAVYDAAALAIIATNMRGVYPGVRGHEPDTATAARRRAEVQTAIQILREATPGSGSYVNETDYFEPDWKRSFWGIHYDKLLAIKHKYDPDGLFVCHHCVGSDEPHR
jgi:FAD/FMN-containing dehydrogenase